MTRATQKDDERQQTERHKNRGLVKRRTAQGKIIWWVRLQHDGKMRWFGSFQSKTEAREFYEEAKTDQRRGQFFPENYQRRGSAYLTDVIDHYMMLNRKRTVSNDRCYAYFWKAQLQGMRLHSITSQVIDNVKSQLYEPKTVRRNGVDLSKTLSQQSVLHYLKFLRHVLNLAVRDGKLSRNPFAQVQMPNPSSGRLRFLTLDEERKLLAAIGPYYAPWVRFAILTGLRRGEQFQLKWADVDFERKVLTIRTTKAGRVQYLLLNEEAFAILKGLTSWKDSTWVFPSQNKGSHFDPSNFFHRVYTPAVKRAGLEDVNWHTLRHTFASRIAMSGGTERDIAECLRHSSTALVKRYVHLSPTHLRGVMEKVSTFGKPTDQPEVLGATVEKGEMKTIKEEQNNDVALQPIENE